LGAERSPGLTEGTDADEGVLRCARHPAVETVLRCGRCETPICPRCLVQTPVGARCPVCANVSKLPTFDVNPTFFARGMTAALISGIVVGSVWAFLFGSGGFLGILTILLGLGIGWAISESVSLATNRKRGLGLQVCAVLGVALAFLLHEALALG
jgi:hypothetical protein